MMQGKNRKANSRYVYVEKKVKGKRGEPVDYGPNGNQILRRSDGMTKHLGRKLAEQLCLVGLG